MKSIKDSFKDLSKFGIKSTKSELCDVCEYGMKITIHKTDGSIKEYCKYCEDKKLVDELNIPKSQEEMNRLKMNDRTKYFSRYPSNLLDVKLNDYETETAEQKKAKKLAIDYIVNFDKKKSLVISGDPGLGKTHIAIAIANALKENNTVLFLKSTHLLDLVRDSYNQAKHTEQDLYDVCSKVDLLVIDDLGAEYTKESDNESWASDVLFKVIDSRLGKSLIITTNYSESLLEQKYGFNGKRITSRMSDGAEKIRIAGKDRRR